MAEKVTLQRLEEQLQCSVCLDTYTDPKVLQCDHVYCTKCLRELLDRVGHSLTCPICRQVTPVPENGVQGLKPAFQINNFIAIKDSLKKKSIEASHCQDHVNEETKLYCETCRKLICFYCVLTGARHHGCEYQKLAVICDQYKGEIISSLEPMKQKLKVTERTLEVFEITHGKISDQQAVMKAKIHNSIDQLHAILEVRREKLITQLHQFSQRKLHSLATRRGHVEVIQQRLQQCQVNVEGKLTTMSNLEIVKEKMLIIEQIEDSSAFFEPDILMLTTTADIKFSTSEEAVRTCQDYGVLSTNETLPNPGQCHILGDMNTLVVGEPAKAVVEVYNFWGEPCLVPQQTVRCKIVSEIKGTTEDVSMEYMKAGHTELRSDHFKLNFTPAIKGRHHLHIKISNQHIQGSPFTLLVKSQLRVGSNQISTITDVNRPWGIVINHKKQIVVTEYEKHRISVFTPDGVKLQSFGTHGSKLGQFNHPCGVAVDKQDNILVADYKNNRIQKFTSDGKFVATVGTKGNETLQFKGPKGIAFNTFNDKVYVVDENYRVQIFNSNLGYCGFFGRPGRMNEALSIACDRSGKVYVPVYRQSQIQVFTADGTFLSVFTSGKFNYPSSPFSLAIDNDDILYVSGHHWDGILAFKPDGEFYHSFSLHQPPRGLAVDSGVVYVCDNKDNCINIF